MYKIIKVADFGNNTELRLAEISIGYTVGLWDLDEEVYVNKIRIYPHKLKNALERAKFYFKEQSNDSITE